MKSLDTLISDVQALFDKGITLDPIRLTSFSQAIGNNFKDRFLEFAEEQKPRRLRMSNVGKPLRQLWYEIRSGLPREVIPADKKFNFMFGDILEDFALFLAVEAGHTVTDVQRKIEVDGVLGSIDCLIDGHLIDIKSCSSLAYPKFRDRLLLVDDPFGYMDQLSGYSAALSYIDSAFWAINKERGQQCLLRFTGEELRQRRDIHQVIRDARDALSSDAPPAEKCYPDVPDGVSKTAPFGNGNRVLGVNCRYCAYKVPCWGNLRQYIYSSGPKWFTHIEEGKEPRVFEVKNGPEIL